MGRGEDYYISPLYILLQTAAIFFLSKIYLKQGIVSEYAMIDFICKGYLELSGTQVKRKFLPTVGFEPGTFRLRSEGATTEPQAMMRVEGTHSHLEFSVLFLESYLQQMHMVDETK